MPPLSDMYRSSLGLLASALLTAAIAGCLPTVSNPHEYKAQPISAEAGAEYFLHTGGGDPYAAGIAYPVFLALMEMYPNELGHDWNEFADKFGFNRDPAAKGDPRAVPIGFHLTTDPNSDVPWLVGNCTLCHSERIRLETGDIVVPGLGSKRARPHQYANAILRIGADPHLDEARVLEIATRKAAEWRVPWLDNARAPIVKATIAGLRTVSEKRTPWTKRFDAALPGRMATIESFTIAINEYRKEKIPFPETIGWAKVPDVASFPFRDTFSYDGSGYGSPQALVEEADFVFGVRPEWYLTHPHIATSMYLYLKNFDRKLPFPKPVDAELAAHGKIAFEKACSKCHGMYVDHGDEIRPSYRERVIPKEWVGTDPARTDAVTPAFVNASNDIPLIAGITRVKNTGGYVPPVLKSIWARGLFGHVGQWPSLEVLATPPAERPRKFIVDTDGLYDLDRVGVRYEIVPANAAPRALKPSEYLYDGGPLGFHVDGHPFLSDLPADDRRAIIEYLKML